MKYQIADWDAYFENNKSRERERCSFCCIPNKQDGLGYGLLMAEPDGEALYGAFVAVVLIASKQKVRKGWLTATGLPAECPLTARQLSVKCRFKDTTIQRMLDVVSSNEIGWIKAFPDDHPKRPSSADAVPAECPPSALEEKRREEKEEKRREVAVAILGHLNSKAGKSFRSVEETINSIMARMAEVDDDIEGIKLMIDRQCARWVSDKKMNEYLRPATLFVAKSNFHEYYDNRNQPVGNAPSVQDPLKYSQF